MNRAYWLDVSTGREVEIQRPQSHMRAVVEHPERFGLSPLTVRQVEAFRGERPIPYEISEYPEWLYRPLLARWIKVTVDSRYVSFTVPDRLTRRHVEAMQDFMAPKRLRQGVFIAGEPSGRMIAKLDDPRDLQTIRQPGELKRMAAAFGFDPWWVSLDGKFVHVPNQHMRYVTENSGKFGLSAKQAETLKKTPYSSEMAHYPRDIVEQIVKSWIRTEVMPGAVAFTIWDRAGRKHFEAMQDFLMDRKITKGRVLLFGQPSSKALVSTSVQELMGAASLRDLRGARAFTEGQVYRGPDGSHYRLVARSPVGWYVDVRPAGKPATGRVASQDTDDCWSWTDRQLHNLICSEGWEPVERTAADLIADDLATAGLGELAEQLLVTARQRNKDRVVKIREAVEEVQQLVDLLSHETDDEQRELFKHALEQAQRRLDSMGLVTEPLDNVKQPYFVSRPNRVTKPRFVKKG